MAVRKKFEEVAEHLELAIFSGRLSVGDKIPSERALMDQFGVGRSTVREALFMLQRKGLLETRPGAPARVSRPDADTLIDDVSGAQENRALIVHRSRIDGFASRRSSSGLGAGGRSSSSWR